MVVPLKTCALHSHVPHTVSSNSSAKAGVYDTCFVWETKNKSGCSIMQAVLFIGDLAYADDYVSALTHYKACFSCMTAMYCPPAVADTSACSRVLCLGRD